MTSTLAPDYYGYYKGIIRVSYIDPDRSLNIGETSGGSFGAWA